MIIQQAELDERIQESNNNTLDAQRPTEDHTQKARIRHV